MFGRGEVMGAFVHSTNAAMPFRHGKLSPNLNQRPPKKRRTPPPVTRVCSSSAGMGSLRLAKKAIRCLYSGLEKRATWTNTAALLSSSTLPSPDLRGLLPAEHCAVRQRAEADPHAQAGEVLIDPAV